MTTSKSRVCESFFEWPALANALPKRGERQVEVFCPIRQHHSFALKGNYPVIASVSLLIAASSPAAIFRRITLVIIDTLNRCAPWARPHVGNKRRKVSPTRANLNSSFAVTAVRRVIRVFAPGSHLVPNFIFGGAMLPVPTRADCGDLSTVATARLNQPIGKGLSPDFLTHAAVAKTRPVVGPIRLARKLFDGEPPKPAANQTRHRFHDRAYSANF